MKLFTDFQIHGRLVCGLNSIFTIVISKKMNYQTMVDYKLISLTRYRLKCVIEKVVYESRSSFLKDIQIVDGVLIANKIVDEAKKNKGI